MAKNIKDTGAVDLKIDSARSLVPVTVFDADLPDGTARGLWLDESVPATVNYEEEDGTERTGLLLLPGPNMVVVKAVLSGGDATLMRAIY